MARINKVMTGFNNISRVGNLVLSTRSSNTLEECGRVVSLIESKGIESNFDVSHDGGGTIIVSEYISQLGTLSLTYQDVDIQTNIFKTAYRRSDNCELTQFTLKDKYKLSKAPAFALPEKVVILAGSNLYAAIDWKYVDKIMQDEEVVIKPHPLTSLPDIEDLQAKYGKDRIVSKLVSGLDLATNATHAWVCRSSELWAVSTLCGVTCEAIPMHNNMGLYNTLIRAVEELHEETGEDKKSILGGIINSKYSGICVSYADVEYKLPYTIEIIKELGGKFNAPF